MRDKILEEIENNPYLAKIIANTRMDHVVTQGLVLENRRKLEEHSVKFKEIDKRFDLVDERFDKMDVRFDKMQTMLEKVLNKLD
jgi:hypothetical protein